MIKKLKIGLSVALLALLAIASSANAAALTWSADQTVDLADSDITILSGSEATSLVVGTDNIQIVVAEGDTFTVTSASTGFSASGNSTAMVNISCETGSIAYAVVIGGSGGETITLTQSGGVCNTGGSGGGGGGGSRPKPPVTPAVPAVPATTPPTDCLPGYLFSPSTGTKL